ncbi:MAG: YifB family Mg chelatase-like AAA ATPase [Deltaproteobacteria bacterium]|nr:YifB family Mg chelatase-like AAA ATPase [Deltaproteobacteria bacterium]
MLSQVTSGALLGIEAYLVEVQVDLARGLPYFTTVGLPEGAVKESKDRVKSALKNCGYIFPRERVTVNLAPADIKKTGAAFDLPIAVGLLAAQGLIGPEKLSDYLLLGELSLDGRLRPVNGALSLAMAARDGGLRGIILPVENAPEAAVVEQIDVLPASHLPAVVEFLTGDGTLTPHKVDLDAIFNRRVAGGLNLNDVRGQEHVKRALEVAAAGGHNMIMIGPPGAGKSMLAQRFPTILPPLSFDEALETTRIYSAVGLVPPEEALLTVRPFRAPHHTISDAGLIGGGQIPRPGEVSLAHHGVLFLDELPEFKKNVLEVMRQPLEDGRVTISRATVSLTFPARFMLIAAMNPCPCGYFTDPVKECTCTQTQIQRYRAHVSGPLLDRIDLHVEVPAVKYKELGTETSGEPSEVIRNRVRTARKIMRDRLAQAGLYTNAQMENAHLRQFCQLDQDSQKLLETAMERLGLSARAYTRIIKLARTIADLEGARDIASHHIGEAIGYRSLDRARGW